MVVRKAFFVLPLLSFMIQECLSADPVLNRGSFPKGFVFGTASSAYQYEGAVKEDGRGPSIWDKYTYTFGKVIDFSNADVVVDQYHRFEEDIQLMANMGMDAYRFSISWSHGSGAVNQAGVDHYNRLINALLAKGIQPYVTLYHWDLPLALEDKYKGWLDRQIIRALGSLGQGEALDNVQRTPYLLDTGLRRRPPRPGRCSILFRLFCRGGNSATESYIVAHNVLLSHAAVADIYRTKYKATQNGSLGIAFDVMWYVPSSNAPEDIEATQRAQDFQLGWFMDPLFFGEYPSSMRTRVGNRLPKFSPQEAVSVKGSLDFVGINYYTTYYAMNDKRKIVSVLLNDAMADSGAIKIPFKNGRPIGDKASSIWLYIVPEGLRSLMNYVKSRYGSPPIFITENGMDDPNNPFTSLKDALKDEKRIFYHSTHLSNLSASIREDGCDVRGYFVWSLLDNWEWGAGYTSRFGLYFVDYRDKLKRYPRTPSSGSRNS
ncbi:unnamed protein product [Spirodela intermedia]|uniref:Uncharacterized protein n=1 Tax=Spirodela intermedia TaxID=51605 RepID=A0A7I8IK96_SPIIN|nr:unnamed protein product [Spirodela intermedia]CAA6657407.1 unnamed protein product [Spirodela intermedia]